MSFNLYFMANSFRRLAVRSWISLCLIEGKPPLAQEEFEACMIVNCAPLGQWVVQLTCVQEVLGSNTMGLKRDLIGQNHSYTVQHL